MNVSPTSKKFLRNTLIGVGAFGGIAGLLNVNTTPNQDVYFLQGAAEKALVDSSAPAMDLQVFQRTSRNATVAESIITSQEAICKAEARKLLDPSVAGIATETCKKAAKKALAAIARKTEVEKTTIGYF